jgi:hypothetical protein
VPVPALPYPSEAQRKALLSKAQLNKTQQNKKPNTKTGKK